jgi:hypothetical protein
MSIRQRNVLSTCLLTVLALLLASAALHAEDDIDWGDDKKTGRNENDKHAPEEPKEPVAINPDLTGPYAEMAEYCQLSPEQQEKIVKVLKTKVRALKKWEYDNKRQIEHRQKKISDAEDAKDREKEQKKLDRLMEGRDRVAQQYDRLAYRQLTREQLHRWYSHRLWKLAEEDLRLIAPPIDDDQVTRIKDICNALAKRLAPGVKLQEHPGAKTRVLKETYQQVLDKEQKKSFARIYRAKQQFR